MKNLTNSFLEIQMNTPRRGVAAISSLAIPQTRNLAMKASSMKDVCLLTIAIAALAHAPVGYSDSYNGTLAAGNVNVAPTDTYGLTCPIGTASVRARATNPNGNTADEISVHVIDPSGRVRSLISLEGVAPPTGVLTGQAGNYLVAVHKDSTLLPAAYSLFMDCFNASGIAFVGTQSALVHNQ